MPSWYWAMMARSRSICSARLIRSNWSRSLGFMLVWPAPCRMGRSRRNRTDEHPWCRCRPDTALARAELSQGLALEAANHARAAAEVQRETGHRLGKAHGLLVLTDALARQPTAEDATALRG